MGTIMLGDNMDLDFHEGLTTGIAADTFCTVTKRYVVDRNEFNWMAKRYYDEMCEFISDNKYMPFIAKLKLLLQNGITGEQLQSRLNKSINTMDKERLNYIFKAISRTTAYQKKLAAKQNNSFTNGNQYIKNNWQYTI